MPPYRWAARLGRPMLPLVLVAFAALATAGPAAATGPFPITESFMGSAVGPQWHLGGWAHLTPNWGEDDDGNGWLRLTEADNSEFGYVFDDDAFSSTDGAEIEFDEAAWAGSGADGMTFFLFDGATDADSFSPGATGSSLGYAPGCGGSPAGLTNAYVGVGFDEYGGFTNLGSCGAADGIGFHPDYISVRGSQADGYPLLDSVPASEGLRGDPGNARHVTLSVTPDGKLSVYVRYPDGTFQTVARDEQLPAAPATLKLGFVASTGGATDIHEIRNTVVVKPTDLTTTVTDSAAGAARGAPLTWTGTVTNNGPNPTTAESIAATTGDQSLTDVSWTCAASDDASCGDAAAGTGLPASAGGAIPVGGTLTYSITGTPGTGTDFAQMTLDAEPTGDTGDLAPADDAATDTTDLTPVFDTDPSFTLDPSGVATISDAATRGGHVVLADQWQRCMPDGTACTDITDASGPTYATTDDDRGHTIRVVQTATNAAGSASDDSPAFAPLPATTITGAPGATQDSGSAEVTFSTATPDATFECSLDDGAWAECASPQDYTDLADGPHAISVRAVYGGLSDPTPPTASFTVDATAPTTSLDETPEALSATAGARFTFHGDDGAGTGVAGFDCRVDTDGWAPCSSPHTLAGLDDGAHTFWVRAVDAAGNVDPDPQSWTWTVDTTAPPAPRITSPTDEQPLADRRPPISFTGEPGATLDITLDDQPSVAVTIGSDGHATWTPTSDLADGTHTISAVAVDAAGNRSPRSPVTSFREMATGPAAPRFTSAPANLSSVSSPAFAIAHDASTSLQCSVDGAAWTACDSPLTLPTLPDGRHTLGARAVNAAGVVSDAAIDGWTIDTTTPPPPTFVLVPDPRTSSHGGQIVLSGEPGATVICSVDGGPPVDCTSGLDVTGLHRGHHEVTAFQVDAAGNSSAPAVDQWVIGGARPSGAAKHLSARVAARSVASADRSLPVGCTLDHGSLRACTVTAYATVGGQRIALGRGEATTRGRRHLGLLVRVRLDRTAQHLIAARIGGLALYLRATGLPSDHPALHTDARTTVYAQTLLVLPDVASFGLAQALIRDHAQTRLRWAAAQVTHARHVTCIGYTDDRGTAQANLALGLRRAQAVCQALRELGVRASISARSMGEGRPRATDATTAGRALNRRVEIQVRY
jgi:outer membrane protein OmpA-like peptidoglycan-associated protein